MILLSGCGTTHYFVPAQPLGEEESAVYVTWHYDLRGLNAPSPIPDFHFYYGAGENANIGLGLAFPVFISHLSAARYWSSDEDFRYAFLHLGQIAGTNMNPFVEGGFGYSVPDGSTVQQFELGLAYGNGTGSPLAAWAMDTKYRGGNRFMPLARYQIAGVDVGASLQYYHGMTAAHLRNLESVADGNWTGPDKLLRAEDIDSVAFYPAEVSTSTNDHLVIFMKSGWQYDLFAKGPEAIAVGQGARTSDAVWLRTGIIPTLDGQLPHFPADSLPAMWFRAFTQTGRGAEFITPDEPFLGRVDSIAAALQRGEDVRLRSYSDIQAEILRQWQQAKRGFWNDLSVGAAIISR